MSGPPSSRLKGPGQIAVGLAISGLGTVAMLAIASRLMMAEQFAAFTTWWLTATLIALAFGVFEVYLARCLLAANAQAPEAAKAITSQLVGQAGLLVVVIGSFVVPLSAWMGASIFAGATLAALALPAFALVGATQSLLRGTATARRRFDVIGVQLGVDGALRPILVTGLVVALPGSVWVAALGTILSGVASILVGRLLLGHAWARPRPFIGAVPTAPVGWLLVAALGPLLIGNAVAPWFAAKASSAALVGGLGAALTLSRIPTQFAAAAFGPLMVRMSAQIESGRMEDHRHTLRRALKLAAAAGAVFTLGFTLLGQWVLALFVGEAYSLPRWVLGALAAASSVLFASALVQSSLSAEERWRRIAASWSAASIAFCAVLLLPLPPLDRAAWAPLTAAVIAISVMLAGPTTSQSKSPGSNQVVNGPKDPHISSP